MDIKKFNPWNWLKDEDSENRAIPVRQSDSQAGAYSPLLSLHHEINRIFDQAFRGIAAPSPSLWNNASLESNFFRPNLDVDSTDKEYRITVEVPGVDEKDIAIELGTDGTLVIRGEKKQEHEEKGRNRYRVERSYGAFQRVLALPQDSDRDNISANFKNGVLIVNVSRKAASQSETRRIDINAGSSNSNRIQAAA